MVGATHRVLLVRQWDQQVGGSGCCGRFSGGTLACLDDHDPSDLDHRDGPWAHARTDMEVMGAVYRELRERYPAGDLEVTVADPRNTAWLLPAVWRDARARGLGPLAALRQAHRATGPRAVVSDGLVLMTDLTAPGAAVDAVAADLAGRRSD